VPDQTARDAWRFVRFLSDHSLDWAAGGQIPVRRTLRNTARFRAMTVQAQFARQVPNIVYGPPVPFIFEAFTEFDIAVEKVLRGSAAPSDALRDAQGRIERIMKRDRAMMTRAARREGP
jgi:multiple sugar transport system substrate-binding protein